MKIKFLKAGSGDSILVQHKTYNILIDGGNDSKYLIHEIDEIYKKSQVLDLLVITHHDDDHISGVIDLLNHVVENNYDDKGEFVKKVFFNSPRRILNKVSNDEAKYLSYKQAFEVEELLVKTKSEWLICNDKTDSIAFDDMMITILSPSNGDLEKYAHQKGAYLSSDFKCDWNSPLSKLEKYINDDSKDSSIPNRSSIVLKFQADERNVLLTGDITPDRFQVVLNQLYEENKNSPVKFDLIKLPHHGSYRSLTRQIIEKIECSNFVISTNSKKNYHPNKRALLKILKFSTRSKKQRINFIFNYEEAINSIEITKKEMKEFNFSLIPNNEKYGFCF